MSLEGKLVSFEGIDGCGKGTQLKLLREALETRETSFSMYREPGGSPVAERIRSILLDPEAEMDDLTEMNLFYSARSDLAHNKTRPDLANGKLVLLDRYYDSTRAYQGAGRFRNEPKKIELINAQNKLYPAPTKTIYLQISVEESTKRLANQTRDRMELNDAAFYARTKMAYDEIADKESHRFVTIDGTLDPQEIHQDYVMPVIDGLYRTRTRSSSA